MTLPIEQWIETVSGSDWVWYVKELSANDTLLNDSNQAGPYIPRRVVERLFPGVFASHELNPRQSFDVSIDSHRSSTTVTVIWYNNKVVAGGTRNECRITNWGGGSSPILDPEATGSLCVFAFHRTPAAEIAECRVWLCQSSEERDAVTDRVGPVEPGTGILHNATAVGLPVVVERVDVACRLLPEDMPPDWLREFPEPAAVVARAVAHLPTAINQGIDVRLLRRRDCEFEIFRSVEEYHVSPRVREGFATVDLFVEYANVVTNRRKMRSGTSLELQTKVILDEERVPYSHDDESENRKRPDFLFPSAEHYRDSSWPADKLRMLAAKTSCKDRWRQVVDEADRIAVKHLLTLQRGVSPSQFAQMQARQVVLVVPEPLHDSYPLSVRPSLLTLTQFIAETRAIQS